MASFSTSQGVARQNYYPGDYGQNLNGEMAYQKSLDQMGDFNTFSWQMNSGHDIRQDQPRYGYDADQLKEELNLDEVTGAADQLKQYGDSLFDIFDQYQGNFDYLGDNAGVSDGELQSRLGESSSSYLANADSQTAQYEREMRRMGINPNAAKFAGFGTSNALQKAVGLSLTQNQVRKDARDESWNENMQVAQLGLTAGNAGVGAVSTAANAYGQAGQQFTNNKIKYDSLNESARQFDNQYAMQQDALKLQAQNQAFGQASDRWQKGILQKNQYNAAGQYQSSDYEFGY